ncbi:MAG: hypothetical protein EHM72_18980 [Calditrichaeota bacterium]|nr:MAG: hypothetical protein EHM72_18980 [Calditrichota bacterium]
MSSVKFVQGNAVSLGGRVVMRDATTIPQESPLDIDTDAVTLAVPSGAVAVNMCTLQQSFKVAVDSGFAKGYALLPSAQVHRIPCADQQPLYVKTESGADSLTFWFEIA